MASLADRLMRLVPKRGPLANMLVQRIVLGLVVVAVAAVPLVTQTPPLGLTEGAPASRTLRANRTVQFIDEEATEFVREQAADSVEPVFVFDTEALAEARGDVAAFFDTIIATKDEHANDTTAVAADLVGEFEDVDEELLRTVAALDAGSVRSARGSAEQLITTVLSRRFTADEMPDAVVQMRESAASLPVAAPIRDLISVVVESAMRPSKVLDEAATDAARQAAADGVDPIVIVKQAGENIVQKGEIVNAEHLEIVRRLGLLEQGGSAPSLVALVVLCAFMVAASGAYVWRYDSAVWNRLRDLAIIAVLFLGTIWLTRAVLWFFPEVSLYLLPVPVAAMLATLLISAREGMLLAVITALSAVLLGFSGGASVVAMLVWSMASVVAVSFMTERRQLFYVGGFLVVSGGLVGLVASLASGSAAGEAWSATVFGSLGGLLAAVFGYGLLPFFEHAFGVTTDVRLLELGNPAHPLMREMMVKAPGTYSHSVMTANLAESAAEAIGANTLLARVGAYYHDIGKIRRPGFFVENQAGSDNPHDTTAPSLSALIITAHVRDGLELAEAHGLPSEIVDIIRQHHGTSLVSYFYKKAADLGGPVSEDDFRYGGQRPTTREAALVMLADSAEAAVRAVKKPTLPRIEATVRKVVDGKMADGQLDEADLTLADIERVVKVYARMLASMYHPRIEYPNQEARSVEHAYQHHESPRA